MRTALCLVCLSLWLSGSTIAEPLPRTGDTIDVAERNYFKLFPTLVDYSLGIVTSQSDTLFFRLISENSKCELNIKLVPQAHTEFIHYLSEFEDIESGRAKVDRRLLSGVVWFVPASRHKGSLIEVAATNGKRGRGRLFHIDTKALILVNPQVATDWHDPNTFTVFSADELSTIKILGTEKLNAVGAGFVLGALIGYAVGSATVNDGPYIFWENELAFVSGVLSAFAGALAGLVIGGTNSSAIYAVDGSQSKLAQYLSRLERKARSPYLPPELQKTDSFAK